MAPQNRDPLTSCHKLTQLISDYVREMYAKFRTNPSKVSFSEKCAKYNEVFFICINTFICKLTYRSEPSMNFHSRWLKRRYLIQRCAF